MPRINERCLEHTPAEMRLNDREIPPGESLHSAVLDIMGAKIHVCWVKSDTPDVSVVFEYLSRNHSIILEETDPIPLAAGSYTRCQFGTYGAMKLPAMFLRMRFHNAGTQKATLTAQGMSQLQ